jgi:hypothetical protein
LEKVDAHNLTFGIGTKQAMMVKNARASVCQRGLLRLILWSDGAVCGAY